MTLTARDVAEITRLLEESSFDELNLELNGFKLSLRRGGAAPRPPEHAQGESLSAPPAAGVASAGPVSRAPPTTADPDVHHVAAPLLGTFYRAPKPGAPAFVDVGTLVQEETIIGIIEVMKLMNTVRAGVRGRVTEILARDGVLVEYGETLLCVSKPSAHG